MNINKLYPYPSLERTTADDGVRHYTCPVTSNALPSVTTILSATADKSGLKAWKEWIGEEKAAKVVKEATDLGSLMHLHIENYIQGIERPKGNNLIRMQAARMADQIITRGLPAVDEVWGMEVSMFMPGMYAGTTDLVGVHDGEPAIMDHKTAKKMRSRDMIVDYFDQMAAYGLAHDEVYGTSIKKGVIFMVDRELKFQAFVLEGLEFQKHKDSFMRRLETYVTMMLTA